MNKNKVLINGICLGVCLFIIAEVVAFAYVSLVMKLVPTGSAWTSTNEILTSSTKIVYWICRPFSSILRILFGSLIRGLLKISMVNIVGWIVVAVLILKLRKKNKSI